MYLWTNPSETGYLTSGQQSGGMFLIAISLENTYCGQGKYTKLHTICCVARHVKMRQLGHFMMGTFRWDRRSITVSGSFGGDGLPKSYMIGDKPYAEWAEGLNDQYLLDHMVKMPNLLAKTYWTEDDGWNSVGWVSTPIRLWALHEPRLYTPQGRTRLNSFAVCDTRNKCERYWDEKKDEHPELKEYLEEWLKLQKKKLNIS